ncbi:MAG: zinc transporter ZntB [Inquilinaceae bacterium]
MTEDDDLICAYVLDGGGFGHQVGWPEIRAWRPDQGVLWVHLDRAGAATRDWLMTDSGIDPVIAGALMVREVRPRVVEEADGLLVMLRGVNLNPGADPEDMVGIRMWLEPQRIVTVRQRRLMAIADIREALDKGQGPTGPGGFLHQISDRMIERMGPVIGDLDDTVDRLEVDVLTAHGAALRTELAEVRRRAIALRRYLAPQRDVVSRLHAVQAPWLSDGQRMQLREIADRTTRYVEDLDSARERAAVTQDELNSRISDQMNRTMYLLSVVAAVLLPPSLLTGLLGINVGGLPGVDNPWAFGLVVALIVAVAVVEVIILRRLRWI